ncbi:MAG: hypothetical protein AAF709_18960, partial [Pseudomonadota bacterium]
MGDLFALVIAAGFAWMTWGLITDRQVWTKPLVALTVLTAMLGLLLFLLWVSVGLFHHVRLYSVPIGLLGLGVGGIAL